MIMIHGMLIGLFTLQHAKGRTESGHMEGSTTGLRCWDICLQQGPESQEGVQMVEGNRQNQIMSKAGRTGDGWNREEGHLQLWVPQGMSDF